MTPTCDVLRFSSSGWAPLEHSRGPEKPGASGGLRVVGGQPVTLCASSRNSAAHQDFLQQAEQASPEGAIYVVTGSMSGHDSKSTRAWRKDHPGIRYAFIPQGACLLNLPEDWWRIFRRQALAGQSFADRGKIAHATQMATAQLNARAQPWIWGRPEPEPRSYRHASYTGVPLNHVSLEVEPSRSGHTGWRSDVSYWTSPIRLMHTWRIRALSAGDRPSLPRNIPAGKPFNRCLRVDSEWQLGNLQLKPLGEY